MKSACQGVSAIYVINKIDQITLEELEVMSRWAQRSGPGSRIWVDLIHSGLWDLDSVCQRSWS